MKRWLLVLMMLVLASCNTAAPPAPLGDNFSYDDAEALLAETSADLAPTASQTLPFRARVTRGKLEGTPLKGNLVVSTSEYAETDRYSAYTVLRGVLELDGGEALKAKGLICKGKIYLFLASQKRGKDALFIRGKGKVRKDGRSAGRFALYSAKDGYNLGNWRLKTAKPADPKPPKPADKTILELAAATPELSTLAAAVKQAGLAETLDSDVKGGLTVFAPTNDAFAALAALPEGDALVKVLTYHVAEGTLRAEDIVQKDAITTLAGADVSVRVVDGGVVLNGAVKVIQADIAASNGIVHLIDAVLIPPTTEEPVEPTDPVEPTEPTDPVEPTEPTDPVEPTDPAPGDDEAQTVLRVLNEARASGYTCGTRAYGSAGPLKLNSRLNTAARKHSEDMRVGGFWGHTTQRGAVNYKVGSVPWDRMTAEGYAWMAAGENIARGYSTAEAAARELLKSPGHCANIMNPNFTELGAGSAGDLYTQVFARPRPAN